MPRCLIHFKGEEGPLTAFSETSLPKFLHCHALWLSLDGKQREIAQKTSAIVNKIKSGDGPTCLSNLQYHRGCYSKFTNVDLIKRAQNRISKIESTNDPEGDLNEPAPEELPVSRKLLRSNTSVKCTPSTRNQAILPAICITCEQEKSYITDSVSAVQE